MGRIFGFVSLVVVLGIGLYLYSKQAASITPGGVAPQTMVDVTGVRNDLLAMANAERRYYATNAKYVPLDQLQSNGDIQIPHRPSYNYSAEVSDNGFKITATYTGADAKAPKRIIVDETMVVRDN